MRILIILFAVFFLTVSLAAQNHFGAPTYDSYTATIIGKVSLDTLRKYDRQLSGALPAEWNNETFLFSGRYAGAGGTQDFRNAAKFIYMHFTTNGLQAAFENDTAGSATSHKLNVIGTLPGQIESEVIVCGHFDSAGPGKPGADDNASGTSGVLELSRLLSRYKFYRTIKFITFGGEELGLLGSKDYAARHKNDSIYAVINLDMIMWDDDADQVVQVHRQPNFGNQYSADLGQYILEVNNLYGLSTIVNIIPNGTTRSDHASFWAQDKSAVLLIEEFTSPSDFNPYYHSVLDTWQKASASKHQQFFKAVTKLAAASVAELAGILGPLPVELTAFTGVFEGNRVILRWSTATETNNAGFAIERLSDERSAVIGFVPGNGTTTEPHSYRFTDNRPAPGTSLYRLRQIDADWTVSFSGWIMVASVSPGAPVLAAYPNPLHRGDPLSIDIATGSTDSRPVRITLHDVLGRTSAVVFDAEITPGLRRLQADLSNLSPGMYFLRAIFPERVLTRKIRVSR